MSVRPAVPADADSIAAIHHDGWTRTYRGLLPDAYLDSLSYDACLARWTSALVDGTPLEVLVAEVEGCVVGFATAGHSREGAVRDGVSRTRGIPDGGMTDVWYLWDMRGRLTREPPDERIAWRGLTERN